MDTHKLGEKRNPPREYKEPGPRDGTAVKLRRVSVKYDSPKLPPTQKPVRP